MGTSLLGRFGFPALGARRRSGGAAAPFAPSDVSGLQFWLKADAGVYSDAGVTPAANGATVQQWNDQSGNGWNLTQATAGNRPTYRSSAFGGTGLVQLSTDDFMTNTAATFPNGATAITAFMLTTHNATGISWVFGLGDGVAGGSMDHFRTGATSRTYTTNLTPNGGAFASPNWLTEVWYDGGQATNALKLREYINGRLLTLTFVSTIASSLAAVNGARVGSSEAAGGGLANGWTGKLHEFLVYNRVLTNTERDNVRAYLLSRLAQDTRPVISCLGDSLTSGSLVPDQWPELLQTAKADRQIINLGQGSSAASEWATWQGQTTYLPNTNSPHVEVVFLGTNDIALGGRSAVQVQGDLTTIWAASRAAGREVVAATIIPRGNFTAPQQTVWTDVNTWIRLQTDKWDALADLAANAAFDEHADASNVTYYQGDTIHLTLTGQTLVKDIVQAAVESL
jgi:hypothetical protein